MPNPTASDPVRIVGVDSDVIIPVEVVGSGSSVNIVNSGEVAETTTALLGNGGVYESAVIDTLNYSVAIISISADEPSANGGIAVSFSTDGVSFLTTDQYTYLNGNVRKTYQVQTVDRYMKVEYTNGATPQGTFNLSIQLKQFAGVASSHRIGDDVSPEDDAQLGVNVIKALSPEGVYHDISTNPQGELNVSVVTPVGLLPVSLLTTLHDGKLLNHAPSYLNDVQGTGTGAFADNKYPMSVTAGQWKVIQSKQFMPYFSGKPQKSEETMELFAPQTDVVKRVGYFSSSTVSPYDTAYDGMWLESSNGTISLKTAREGTLTIDEDITQWTGYDRIGSYQNLSTWDFFTVFEFNFLWLGGAYVELRLVTPESGFVTAHKKVYAGTSLDMFIRSPNQPVRYEVRSTTGAGSFTYICNQVATGGSINESGFSKGVNTGHLPINFNVIGTKYPIIAIQKQAAFRDNPVRIENLDIFVTSADRLLWTLEVNPSLSAPLSYVNVPESAVRKANGNGAITVSSAGTIIANGYLTQNTTIPSGIMAQNFMSLLGGKLDGTQDEMVLCLTPITTNIDAHAAINFQEG